MSTDKPHDSSDAPASQTSAAPEATPNFVERSTQDIQTLLDTLLGPKTAPKPSISPETIREDIVLRATRLIRGDYGDYNRGDVILLRKDDPSTHGWMVEDLQHDASAGAWEILPAFPANATGLRNGSHLVVKRAMPFFGLQKGQRVPVVWDGEHVLCYGRLSWSLAQLEAEIQRGVWDVDQ